MTNDRLTRPGSRYIAKSIKKITLAKELQPGDESHKLTSAWGPLRVSLFRALWIASVASYIGTWMQDVGEAWLMTSLTPSSVLVALVETAGSLPVVLVALPAGALADVVDRRRLLLVMQSWMCVISGLMGLVALTGQMQSGGLLQRVSASLPRFCSPPLGYSSVL